MPVLRMLNIPWETHCNVIPGTIKCTEAMQLRRKKVRWKNEEINRFFSIKYCFGISNFFKTSKKIVRCHFSLLGLSVIESRSLF